MTAEVDPALRRQVCAHHTATHLLQSALKRVLGADTCQQGSLVEAQRLRYGQAVLLFVAALALTRSTQRNAQGTTDCWLRVAHLRTGLTSTCPGP